MDTLNISNDSLNDLTVYNKGGFKEKILLYNENMLLLEYFNHTYLDSSINFADILNSERKI